MKCPKCHYLSFDPAPRCRNCGFDLEGHEAPDFAFEQPSTVVHDTDDADLVLREFADEVEVSRAPAPAASARELTYVPEPDFAPMADPSPRQAARARMTAVMEPEEPAIDPEAPVALEEPVAPAVSVSSAVPFRAPHTTSDLPLFVKAVAEREARVSPAAVLTMDPPLPEARPPLSVRRDVAPPVRSPYRRERKPGPIDQDLLEDLRRVEREEATQTMADARAIAEAAGYGDRTLATSRLMAAATDAALLGGIAAFVLWGTLRVSDATIGVVGLAAWVPFAAFVLAVAVGYLVMFTAAGGQTIGMMLAGIRVVAEGPRGRTEEMTLPLAVKRAALTLLAILPMGLGWIPALFGRGIALHDRLSHTRVVRA